MSGTYSLGVRSASVAVTGGGIFAEIATSSTIRARIKEIGLFWATGVAPVIGIGRPGNTPTTGTAALGIAEDTSDPASTVNVYTAGWGTAPTVPSSFIRRISLPATAGNGVVFSWPYGDEAVLGTTRNLGLVVWCISLPSATATTIDLYARWTE